MMEPVYIMSPSLYESLKCVKGFTDRNGKTYMEHICIILGSILNNEQMNIIKSLTKEEDALNYLKTLINITHTFTR